MIRDDLTWETNSTLSYPSNDGHLMRYKEAWHTVRLVLTDYTVTSTITVSDWGAFGELEGDDWKPLTPEGRKRYLDLRLDQLRPATRPFLLRLSGTADLGQKNTINVVHIANAPFPRSSYSSDPGFKAGFEKVEVLIGGGDADRGTLHFDGSKHLFLQFLIHSDKMHQLVEDIRSRGELPRLEITAVILLFQDEFASRYDGYVLPADPGLATASLCDMNVSWGRIPADTAADEAKVASRAETNRLLKAIKTAVWTLFTVVAVAAILHLR